MLRVLFIFFTLTYSLLGWAQGEPESLVKWMTLKEAQEKNKQVQKPILLDFYTSWCGWCKHMMKTTYSNPAIAGYINANFYPVKFDAEGKDTVEYNGKIYKPLSPEPKTPHELAVKFLGTNLSYPSTIFITNNYEFNLLTKGYLDEKKIEPMLVFMVENAWRTSVYEEFARHFTNTFYDTVYKKVPVKVYSFNEMERVHAKKPKKVIVNIGTGFCNTCRVMRKTTFNDTLIAEYLNKNYYVVDLNAESNDTIVFKKEKHYKTLFNGFPLHSLGARLSGNQYTLPVTCILDEQLNTIQVLNYYQAPEHLGPVLEFFASNKFKTTTWADFMKEYSTRQNAPKKK